MTTSKRKLDDDDDGKAENAFLPPPEAVYETEDASINNKPSKMKHSSSAAAAVPDLWDVTGTATDEGILEIAALLPKGLRNCARQVAHFHLFLYERQMVWERRNRGDWEPWSESKAMQMYFFCNNYRELDRGTNYFRAHVLDLWDKYGSDVDHQTWIEHVLWASVCYRLINRISTFEAFGCVPELSDWPRFQAFVRQAANNQIVLFTNAHQTSGLGPFCDSMSSLYRDDAHLVKRVSEDILASCQERDLEGCFRAVKTIKGAGRFVAWQIVCDLMESQCLQPCTENDWTELGPGARGGINIVFGDGKQQHDYSYLELAMLLQQIQDDVFRALGIQFPRFNGLPLTLKNIEHPLCEFKKYNVIHGNLRRDQANTGQRRVRSRGAMDCDKSCHNVAKCGVTDDVLFCDKCLVGYCEGCASRGKESSSSNCWICPRCTAFERSNSGHGSCKPAVDKVYKTAVLREAFADLERAESNYVLRSKVLEVDYPDPEDIKQFRSKVNS